MKYAKFYCLIILCLILMQLLLSCDNRNTIKIGFSGQLSGVYADLGSQGRDGALLAVRELNRSGGINGRKLELIERNDKNTVKGAIDADAELVKEGVEAIIGHMTSSQTLAALPVLRKYGIPLISPTSSSPVFQSGADGFFRVNSVSTRTASVFGVYAHDYLGIRSAAIVYDIKNNVFTLPYSAAMTDAFMKSGGSIDLRVMVSPDNTVDWNSIVARIREEGIDAVFMVTTADDLIRLLETAEHVQSDIQVLSSGWALTDEVLRYEGKLIEKVIFINTFNSYSKGDGFLAFKEKFSESFDYEPGFPAAQSYESVLFLAEGLRRQQNSGGDLNAALQSIDRIDGVMGTIRFDESGEVQRPLFISQIRNREWVVKDLIVDADRFSKGQ